MAAAGSDRAGLEQLCNHITRPQVANDPMEATAEGNGRYHFRKAWRNGATFVEYKPLEFLAHLVPLIADPDCISSIFMGYSPPGPSFVR